MAEYYAVLSRAISSLEANGPDTRRAVYDKARNALIGQLKAIDPPLPTHEISRQRLELEEAIRKVEREAGAAPGARTGPSRPAPVATPPTPAAAPEVNDADDEAPPRQSPQDVFRRAIQEAERVAAGAPRMERTPVAARSEPAAWTGEPPARAERAARTPPPARPAQSYLPSQGYVEEPPAADEPRLAPDYDWEPPLPAHDEAAEAGGAPSPRVTPDAYADDRGRGSGKVKRGKQRGRIREDIELLERHATPSRLPAIILVALIVAMLVGLGALAWWQRGPLSELIASFDSGQKTVETASAPPATTATPPPATDTSGKNTDRLLATDGQTMAPDNVRNVTPPPDDGSAPATTTADTSAPTVTPDTTAPAATTAGQTTADNSAPDPDALVAQRATLYEEPLDAGAAASGVIAIDANVRWSYAEDGPDGPEVVAQVEVPERNLKVKVTFRRNTDQTLPASHVVEVVIDAPASFPGKGIREVPRIVLKPGEDQRGQPLIGASAKVADGFFWIALSGVDTDIAANVRLMKEQSWIDLPLVYDTGQRAILTFEKGNPGSRVFERALAAWASG